MGTDDLLGRSSVRGHVQSVYRERYPEVVDDIGNLAYLGKLQNIRKNKILPWDYFADCSDDELLTDYLIDRSLLADDRFENFVTDRRARILERVRSYLGR